MTLQSLGWSAFFEAHRQDSSSCPARVLSQGADLFLVHDGDHEFLATPRGRLRSQPDFPPVVGDWVFVGAADGDRGVVEAILPRRTAILRKQSGPRAAPQVLAANVDRVLLVTSMNQDFSVRRLERYLTLVWESGATPMIALTKADLVPDPTPFRSAAETCALGFPVLCVSSVTGAGIPELRSLLVPGETIVLLGSSGVGKSTLVNLLGGGALRSTKAIRQSDGKGRHATTDRHLVPLPTGALLIDTPGLREVSLWASDDALSQSFPEIAAFAGLCRFRDCHHDREPGCAVRDAVERGELDAARLASLHQLQRELDYLERQSDPLSALEHKRKTKRLMRAVEQQYRGRLKP